MDQFTQHKKRNKNTHSFTHLQSYLVKWKLLIVVVMYPSAESCALVLKSGLCSSQRLKWSMKTMKQCCSV